MRDMSNRKVEMQAAIDLRVNEIFFDRYDLQMRRTDRLFAYLNIGQWVFGILLAVVFSPTSWAGKVHVLHLHVWIAVIGGAVIAALPLTMARLRPGERSTRYVMAVAQMLWSALFIHLTGGRIETHFHIFGSLAFLAFYRDWTVLVSATLVITADHVLRQFLCPESVFGIVNPEAWRFLEHVFWVLFEDTILVISCVTSVRDMQTAASQQAVIETTQRLKQEMAIASSIQLSILPRKPDVPGLEIAGEMHPADEVGGDYYDVIPVEGGCWLGIGDVAGHGLIAGLVMMQTQSAIGALIAQRPDSTPRDVLAAVNKVYIENVQHRLGQSAHMTLSLLRYFDDGRVIVAGAHEEAVLWRGSAGRAELLPTSGTWLGMVSDIGPTTVESSYALAPGDLLVLYTDGLIQAMNRQGEQFDTARLLQAVESSASMPVEKVRDQILSSLAAWTSERADDITVLVVRHVGIPARTQGVRSAG